MPHQLLLATRNKGKIEEFRRILDAIAPGQIELLGLDKFPDLHDVVEDGETFQENALKKAREMSLATGLPAIADDSGLCVDVLNGDPGIFSARWAGSHGDDQANTAKVLTQLRDVPDEKRSAHFTCVAALYLPDGRSHSEEAHFEGWILRAPIGEQGFGYDPIFQPDGAELTLGEFAHGEKDKISHRGIAMRAIAPRILELL